MIIIGLGHASRQGKDTLGKLIVERCMEYKYKPSLVSFAFPLKQVCWDMYEWAGVQPGYFYDEPENAGKRTEILPELGMTPVELWGEVGMKMRRVHSDTWVNRLFSTCDRSDCDVLVITDVRFENEVDAIHKRGGHVFKVERPDVEPLDTPADQALKNYKSWDGVFIARSIAELIRESEMIVDDYVKFPKSKNQNVLT